VIITEYCKPLQFINKWRHQLEYIVKDALNSVSKHTDSFICYTQREDFTMQVYLGHCAVSKILGVLTAESNL